MSLPALYDPPDSPEAWRGWAFNHAAIHYTIIDAIGRQKRQNLTQFLLFPFNTQEPGTWLWQHQVSHNQANAALGTSGFDMLALDWTDPDQFNLWLQMNGDEHTQWGKILGIG